MKYQSSKQRPKYRASLEALDGSLQLKINMMTFVPQKTLVGKCAKIAQMNPNSFLDSTIVVCGSITQLDTIRPLTGHMLSGNED